MASTQVSIPMSRLMKNITLTVRVKHARTWPLRKWLGVRLIMLAAACFGCGVYIETERSGSMLKRPTMSKP